MKDFTTSHVPAGGPRKISDDEIEAVIVRALESQPENTSHWSSRKMARVSGISTSSVQRIWRAFGLQPHRADTFKLSKDLLFVDKVRDVVGLYLNPPERALVLCVDEKSQIQALDRSATGKIIGQCYNRHRAQEFKKFLAEIEANVPEDMDIHIIMDNYATHKTPAVRNWFARRARRHVHFTPTSASWLNLVERFFAELTEKQIKRGAHRSVPELKNAILSYIDKRNADPKPFKWIRTADQILTAIKRYCQRLGPVINVIPDPGH